jgi:carboxypeptidase C (cathepsin A)
VFQPGTPVEEQRRKIEAFATRELAHALLIGAAHDGDEQARVFARAADFLGLPAELVRLAHGRVPFWRFARELLKPEQKVVGFYDATITGVDPFPDRDYHQAPDPTLAGIERVFASAINHVLRAEIGIDSERRYELLSLAVNRDWKRDDPAHALWSPLGATDDLRFAMSMNPDMKVLIAHGYYDMVTPYFSSERLVGQMCSPNSATSCSSATSAAATCSTRGMRRAVPLGTGRGASMRHKADTQAAVRPFAEKWPPETLGFAGS